jgi:hypothetical protein
LIAQKCLVTEVTETKFKETLFGALVAPAKSNNQPLVAMHKPTVLPLLAVDGEDQVLPILKLQAEDGEDHQVLPILKPQAAVDGEDHQVLPILKLQAEDGEDNQVLSIVQLQLAVDGEDHLPNRTTL